MVNSNGVLQHRVEIHGKHTRRNCMARTDKIVKSEIQEKAALLKCSYLLLQYTVTRGIIREKKKKNKGTRRIWNQATDIKGKHITGNIPHFVGHPLVTLVLPAAVHLIRLKASKHGRL